MCTTDKSVRNAYVFLKTIFKQNNPYENIIFHIYLNAIRSSSKQSTENVYSNVYLRLKRLQ